GEEAGELPRLRAIRRRPHRVAAGAIASYGTSAKSNLGRHARLRTLQYGGGGFEFDGRSNHRPSTQCPTGGAVAAGEFCVDAAWRPRACRPAAARPADG